MKKYLAIISLMTILVSCNPTISTSEDLSEPTTQTSYASEQATSSDGSALISEEPPLSSESEFISEDPVSSEVSLPSEEPPASSENVPSSENPMYLTNIGQIKALGETYRTQVNEQGYYVSDVLAKFDAQVLTVHDYVATTALTQYKALVANETGYIVVHISKTTYTRLDEYKHLHQVNEFIGYVAVFNDEIAVHTLGVSEPRYLADAPVNYDYRDYAIAGDSIAGLLTRVKARKMNLKGVNSSEDIYKYTLVYITKLEAKIGLFSDGVNIIQVHGYKTLNNGLTPNSVYDVYGREGMYLFKPQFELISWETNNSATLSANIGVMSSPLSATTLYDYKYVRDSASAFNANMRYADILVNVYYFAGYANYYTKGNNDFIVFEDTLKTKAYTTYTNALNAKAMFVNNEDGEDLYSQYDWDHSPYTPYVPGAIKHGTKVGFYFIGYEYNSNKYWKVQILSPLVELD